MTSSRPTHPAEAKLGKNPPQPEPPSQASGPSAPSAQSTVPVSKRKIVTVADRRKVASSPKAPYNDHASGSNDGKSDLDIKALLANDPSIKALYASPAEMATRRLPFKAGVNTEGIKENWEKFVMANPFESTALPASRMPKANMWDNDGQGYKDLERECNAVQRLAERVLNELPRFHACWQALNLCGRPLMRWIQVTVDG